MSKPAINILNSYFDHIYVITLQRAKERHEKINQVLEGLNYSFFMGKDNKEFVVAELQNKGIYCADKAKKVHRYSKGMTPGMIGCSWSHKLVYEDILKKNYKKVLILEDDVFPVEEGLLKFDTIINELPQDWELLYFDYNKNDKETVIHPVKKLIYHVQKQFGQLKWSHRHINNLFAKPYSKHLKIAGHHDYTDAYAITNSGAKKLLELQNPIAFWPDHLLAYACSNKIIKAFISVPKLFLQESQTNKSAVGSYAEEA
jgi:glycosyl transferase family 25